MGKRRGSGACPERSEGEAGKRGSAGSHPPGNPPITSADLREAPVAGAVPRFELLDWRERFGVAAGITGRGPGPGRGFDLGLWSDQPVSEVMDRWLAFRREMVPFKAVVLGNQVHGVEVKQVDQGEGWIQVERIDGWITTSPGILLTVTIADCVPVYLAVPGRGVALLHAGWRGTAGGILSRGIEQVSRTLRVSSSEIVMHCGVGICGDCYEVGSEVMTGCGLSAPGPGPWHLDLRSHLVNQARTLSLTQITTSSWCSAHDRSTFYSHRASRGSDGRMVAYLGIPGI